MTRLTPHAALPSRRRAAAVVAFVAALLVIGTMILTVLQTTAIGTSSYLSHYWSTGAFYAAESGIEMAIRESNQGSDIDSDGAIGTISNNGNSADDPSLSTGTFNVSVTGQVYTAAGAWQGYRRTVEATTE